MAIGGLISKQIFSYDLVLTFLVGRYAYKIFVSEHHSWFCVVTKNSMNCIIAIQKGDKILAINAIAAAWQHIDASWLWSGCC